MQPRGFLQPMFLNRTPAPHHAFTGFTDNPAENR
jgi:hypothetical protein